MEKIIKKGNEKNRYFLSLVVRDKDNMQPINNEKIYYYSNHLEQLKEIAKLLKKLERQHEWYDINIFDTTNKHFVY